MLKDKRNDHFSCWLSGWQLDVRVAPGIYLILVLGLVEVRGYGWCILVDQSHGGMPFHWLVGLFCWSVFGRLSCMLAELELLLAVVGWSEFKSLSAVLESLPCGVGVAQL